MLREGKRAATHSTQPCALQALVTTAPIIGNTSGHAEPQRSRCTDLAGTNDRNTSLLYTARFMEGLRHSARSCCIDPWEQVWTMQQIYISPSDPDRASHKMEEHRYLKVDTMGSNCNAYRKSYINNVFHEAGPTIIIARRPCLYLSLVLQGLLQ